MLTSVSTALCGHFLARMVNPSEKLSVDTLVSHLRKNIGINLWIIGGFVKKYEIFDVDIKPEIFNIFSKLAKVKNLICGKSYLLELGK